MRILLASSEAYPFSKTGGLADMVGALARALAKKGHEVGLVTPLYLGLRERLPGLSRFDFPLNLAMGLKRIEGEIWTLNPSPKLTIFFVHQPEFYQRSSLYQKDGLDYPDNAERFLFFSKAVTELAVRSSIRPEILHAHDWQAAPSILFLAHERRLGMRTRSAASVLTIHNLAYQGLFPASQYALTNLPWDYFTASGTEFYGRMNCLKAGIAFADLITTVSPTYAEEITTVEYGAGLDGLLRQKSAVLSGILNGVDYAEWDPSIDPHISHHFSPEDLDGKRRAKAALQAEYGLPQRAEVPLFGNIGRMVEQKGVDILLNAMGQSDTNLQFVMLGSGAPEYQTAFQALARRYPDRINVKIGFDEGLSHRLEAGSDFFLMPSRFEPCGLNQMYSLRYGTVPIVRAVGGLDDSIIDPREDADKANGIKFNDYSAEALIKAVRKALAIYDDREVLNHFRQNGMKADFSWERTADRYVDVYERSLRTARV